MGPSTVATRSATSTMSELVTVEETVDAVDFHAVPVFHGAAVLVDRPGVPYFVPAGLRTQRDRRSEAEGQIADQGAAHLLGHTGQDQNAERHSGVTPQHGPGTGQGSGG